MVFRYCFGMIMSVSTLMIFSGAATPSSVVNLSMVRSLWLDLCCDLMVAGRACNSSRPRRRKLQDASKLQSIEAFNPIAAANPRVNPSVNPGQAARGLFRAGLDLLHVGVGQAEMVANFVDQDVADDLAEGFVVLRPVIQDRPPVEPDHVR